MSREFVGENLESFKEPIHYGLKRYEVMTDGDLSFDDLDSVSELVLTPEKPNTARATTGVTYRGQEVGTLYVIAFAPEDGTGDTSLYRYDDFRSVSFPNDPKFFPRSKNGIHTELHFTIASQVADGSRDPVAFAGHLAQIGCISGNMVTGGYVGQESHSFSRYRLTTSPMTPMVTQTCGYKIGNSGEAIRFGDPHAMFNDFEDTIQIAGFLALSPEVMETHGQIVTDLSAAELKFY